VIFSRNRTLRNEKVTTRCYRISSKLRIGGFVGIHPSDSSLGGFVGIHPSDSPLGGFVGVHPSDPPLGGFVGVHPSDAPRRQCKLILRGAEVGAIRLNSPGQGTPVPGPGS